MTLQLENPVLPGDTTSPEPASDPSSRTNAPSGADGGNEVSHGRRRLTPGARTLVWILTASAVLCGWVIAYTTTFSAVQESRDQRVLYSSLRQGLSEATTPIGGVIEPGTPIAVLDAPGSGLSEMVVVEGTTSTDLKAGPGHRRDTPLPGQAGVSVLFGRGSAYGGPFAPLVRAAPGTTIRVTTGQGTFTYTIDRVRSSGDPLPPPLAAGSSRLSLVTSTGSGWLGKLAPDRIVYVDASLQGKPVASPPGRLLVTSPAEQAMATDPTAWVPLVFWLQLLALTSIGLVWAAVRWGRWQTWAVGIPLLVAVVWGATDTAFSLLPNLL